jgi:hypothetical protein
MTANTSHLEQALAALAQRNTATNETAAAPANETSTPSDDNTVVLTRATRETLTTVTYNEEQQWTFTRENGDIVFVDTVHGDITIPHEIVTPAVQYAISNAGNPAKARRFAEIHLALQGYNTLDPNTVPVNPRNLQIQAPAPVIPGATIENAINVDDEDDDPLSIYEEREKNIAQEKANGEHRQIRSLRDIEEDEEEEPLPVPPPRSEPTPISAEPTPTPTPRRLRWEDLPIANVITNPHTAFASSTPQTFDLPQYTAMRDNFGSFDTFLRLIQNKPHLNQRVKLLEYLFDSQRSMT